MEGSRVVKGKILRKDKNKVRQERQRVEGTIKKKGGVFSLYEGEKVCQRGRQGKNIPKQNHISLFARVWKIL